jgi:hypothetical protein
MTTVNVTPDQLDSTDPRRVVVSLTSDQVRDLYRTMTFRKARELTATIADDIVERIKSGDVTERDLSDAIHEACDGCLVYTIDCVEYVWGSDADAMEEARGAGFENPDEMALAFFALRADVTEELDERGYGYNGDAWDVSDDDDAADTTTTDATV